MKKILLWGFETSVTCHAFKVLEKQDIVSIKAWFGEARESSVVTHTWYQLVFEDLNKKQVMQCEKEVYDKVYSNLYVFMDALSREFYFYNKTVHEYLNVFNSLINYFYTLLKVEQVEVVLYDDIPHGAPDFLLYRLAKEMGIETIIVSPSLFSNRFFYTRDIEDFGYFNSIPLYDPKVIPVQLKKGYEKDLFYMKETTFKGQFTGKIRKMKNFSSWKTERMNVWKNTFRKYDGIRDFLAQRITGKLLDKKMKKCYKERLGACFVDSIDLSLKFIYFPLHLQPEMTTSALGGIYCDQLLAIERLSKCIPEDWSIYVKENPKQTSFMRGTQFFERLNRIPKVKGVSNRFNTYDLMKHCQFVATITGTAGWEAISGGKNTLVFGKAWYRNLPGVFEYYEGISLQEIADYTIDHTDLETQLAELMKRSAVGLVSHDYLETVPDYNEQENNENLVNFFQYIFQLPSLEKNIEQQMGGNV